MNACCVPIGVLPDIHWLIKEMASRNPKLGSLPQPPQPDVHELPVGAK